MEIQNVHCKVSYNGELRRFLFTGTEFSSLSDQIRKILNLTDKEFVLKYKDDEGDMITLSTTNELAFAISCLVPPQTLRLDVVFTEGGEKNVCSEEQRCRGWEERKQWKMEKKWRRKSGGGRCGGGVEARKERIKKCIERLSAIPPHEGKLEWRQKRIQCLSQKLAWLETIPVENGDASPSCKKPRRECNSLTPEKKEQIELTKAKIRSLKDTIFHLKGEITNRKTQYPEANDEIKEQLAREITQLKEQVKEIKGQLFPLRQEIRQLYHQN
jgi:gas vesicle protein